MKKQRIIIKKKKKDVIKESLQFGSKMNRRTAIGRRTSDGVGCDDCVKIEEREVRNR